MASDQEVEDSLAELYMKAELLASSEAEGEQLIDLAAILSDTSEPLQSESPQSEPSQSEPPQSEPSQSGPPSVLSSLTEKEKNGPISKRLRRSTSAVVSEKYTVEFSNNNSKRWDGKRIAVDSEWMAELYSNPAELCPGRMVELPFEGEDKSWKVVIISTPTSTGGK